MCRSSRHASPLLAGLSGDRRAGPCSSPGESRPQGSSASGPGEQKLEEQGRVGGKLTRRSSVKGSV